LFNSQSSREQTTDSQAMVVGQYDHVAGRTRIAADVSFDRAFYHGIYPYPSETEGGPVLINHDSSLGTRWGTGARVTHPLPGHQTVTIGGEFLANVNQNQWDTFSDPLVANFTLDNSSTQSALYVQDEIQIRPWLFVNGGVRYDRYDHFARTTPRAAVIVMPTPNQSFKYLYGRAFRAPNAYELYFYRNSTSVLRPESIGTHEVVWEQYVGEGMRTSVSAYHYTASQLITFDIVDPDGGFIDAYAFANVGTVRANGLEGEMEVRSKGGIQAIGSYALQRGEDATRTRLTNSPGQLGKFRISVPGPIKQSVASAEVQYMSSRRTVAGTSAAGATIANVIFSSRMTTSLELIGTIRNLFDQSYADPASDEHLPDVIQQNGRTARIGIRWTLGK
jgi:outer membrane receptor for ferrienterochelin and colicins